MKRSIRFAIVAVCLTVVTACGHRAASLEDFDVTVYVPHYASGFEIVGTENAASTIIKVRNPWQGAESIETKLLIARNGEQAPDGFDGQILRNDAERVICMSSTHVAMLDAAGAVPAVVGVSGLDYVSNEYVSNHRDRIGDVGYDGNIDYERVIALNPDLVLLFGVNGASGMESKLRELDIPFVYVGEYLEESPLGKAEWMIAVGETVGRRSEAEKAFAPIPERYNALKRRIAETTLEAPSVMLNTPYGDSWFMPSTGNYVAQLITDAGGHYIYTKNDTDRSQPIGLEEAYLLTSQADMWINVQAASLDDLRRRFPKFADARCIRNGYVWACDRRTNPAGGNDYWESGVVHPDLVLRDLVKIFHPESVEDEFVYYRRLE